jgi:hypothetical protein
MAYLDILIITKINVITTTISTAVIIHSVLVMSLLTRSTLTRTLFAILTYPIDAYFPDLIPQHLLVTKERCKEVIGQPINGS